MLKIANHCVGKELNVVLRSNNCFNGINFDDNEIIVILPFDDL